MLICCYRIIFKIHIAFLFVFNTQAACAWIFSKNVTCKLLAIFLNYHCRNQFVP